MSAAQSHFGSRVNRRDIRARSAKCHKINLLATNRATWLWPKTSPSGNAHLPAPGNRLNLRGIPICRSATAAWDAAWRAASRQDVTGIIRGRVVRPRNAHAPGVLEPPRSVGDRGNL